MYSVFKRFKLPIGHRLSKHAGRCHNLHGHNFVVEIQLSTLKLNSNDMVIDFHDLKQIINELIDKYDHAVVLNTTDISNINHFTELGYRIEFLNDKDSDKDPTAEVFSEFLFYKFKQSFPNHKVDFVRIWESDDSMAEYSE